MPDSTDAAVSVVPVTAPVAVPDAASRWLPLEVLAVLLLAVFPPLLHAAMKVSSVSSASYSATMYQGALLIRSIQIAAPVLYLMWRSGEGWSFWGLDRPRWLQESAQLLVLLGAWTGVAYLLMLLERRFHLPHAHLDPRMFRVTSLREWAVVVPAMLANGFAEELVMRGYLIRRLEQLKWSGVASVLVTSLLFGSYHLYYGVPVAVAIGVHGLIVGAMFLWTHRLWPIVATHALWDLAIVVFYSYRR